MAGQRVKLDDVGLGVRIGQILPEGQVAALIERGADTLVELVGILVAVAVECRQAVNEA